MSNMIMFHVNTNQSLEQIQCLILIIYQKHVYYVYYMCIICIYIHVYGVSQKTIGNKQMQKTNLEKTSKNNFFFNVIFSPLKLSITFSTFVLPQSE